MENQSSPDSPRSRGIHRNFAGSHFIIVIIFFGMDTCLESKSLKGELWSLGDHPGDSFIASSLYRNAAERNVSRESGPSSLRFAT